MSGKTVTRADLCEAVCQKVGLSRTKCATLVELVLKEITDCLERGETVKLSSFGLFVVRKKGQRMGRNPKTGEEAPISPRRVVVFKPSASSSSGSMPTRNGTKSPASNELTSRNKRSLGARESEPAKTPCPDRHPEIVPPPRAGSNKHRASWRFH